MVSGSRMKMLLLNNNTMYINNKVVSSTPSQIYMPSTRNIISNGSVSNATFSINELMSIKSSNCKSCGH